MQHLYFVALGLQRLWPALPSVWHITGCTQQLLHTHVHLEMLQLLAKKRKDYAFWHQFVEKPSILPVCTGAVGHVL